MTACPGLCTTLLLVVGQKPPVVLYLDGENGPKGRRKGKEATIKVDLMHKWTRRSKET